MSDFTPEEEGKLASGNVSIGYFFRMESDPMLRLWSGAGDAQATPDDPIAPNEIFAGIGLLSGIPDLNQLINGKAERISFTVSGVDAKTLALADSESESVNGADVRLGVQVFDDQQQPMGRIKWIKRYKADCLVSDIQTDKSGKQVRTVTMSVGSKLTNRRRPFISFYSDIQQRLRSPTDRFCERVARYTQTVTKKWPRF